MTERPKLKLDAVGDSATITVRYVNPVKTKYGTKLVFVGTTDAGQEAETPLIPDTSADKQLARLKLDRASVVGERITFSRAPNPSGQPFWNLDVAEPPKAPSKRLPPPPVGHTSTGKPIAGLDPEAEDADDESAYLAAESDPEYEAWSRAIDEVAQPAPTPRETADVALAAKKRADFLAFYVGVYRHLAKALPTDDAQAIQAATATCIIQMDRRGLLPT